MKKIPIALLGAFTVLAASSPAPAATINADFSNQIYPELSLNGSAELLIEAERSFLRLTNDFGQVGSAFAAEPIPFDAETSFSTSFNFQILDPTGVPDLTGRRADGLTFLIQSVGADALGGGGGGLGSSGISPSLGVEFDTFRNPTLNDVNGNHVAINLNGAVDSVIQQPLVRPLNNEEVRTAWVDYDGETNLLEVRLSETAERPETPVLTYSVDAASLLNRPEAFVGFTSGTGAGSGRHRVLSWQFESSEAAAVPEPASLLGLAGVGVLGAGSWLRRKRQ